MILAKVMPQSLPLEEAVLGAIMLDSRAFTLIADMLKPKVFYSEAHRIIFAAFIELYDTGSPIDLLTTTELLTRKKNIDAIGGAYYLVELTNRVASAANIEYHARIIFQKYLQRTLIELSNDLTREAYNDVIDVFELIEKTAGSFFEAMQYGASKGAYIRQFLPNVLSRLELLANKEIGLSGVPSGFVGLDRITSGWQSSDLIVLAARPGMGKTSFICCIALNAAMSFKKRVAIFSLEMSSAQITQRILSIQSSINNDIFKTGDLSAGEWEKLNNGITELSSADIYIDDTAGLTLFNLRAAARRLKMNSGIDLLIVDYIQIMGVDGNKNREQAISEISRGLKAIAKELNIPVIALSQLSRAVETRGGDKRPLLSDLRESGAIEQDADMVGFLYRPEYYGITETEEGESTANAAELIIAKHRNGTLGVVNLTFDANTTRFGDKNTLHIGDNDCPFF